VSVSRVAIGLAITLLFTGKTRAEVRYTVTDLGYLGQHYAEPYAVNDHGQVAGVSITTTGQTHAFFHDGSGMIDISATTGYAEGVAFGLNDHGQVVGYTRVGQFTSTLGYVWSAGSGLQTIGDLGGGFTIAHAINNSGQVTGESFTAGGADHAFLWSASTGMQDLGALAGNSVAYDINDHEQVVGNTTTPAGVERAFVWTASGGMVPLGTLGGRHSFAYGINDVGQVVGDAQIDYADGNQRSHAFLWSLSSGMIDLGTLGGNSSVAESVNEAGIVVGYAALPQPDVDSQVHAFVWDGATMLDLNDLIDPLSGWHVLEAHAINDGGQIVGIAKRDGALWGHGVLLTPIPEPAGALLAVCSLTTLRRRRS
jgi:probable HAF family extracellular repeat protein